MARILAVDWDSREVRFVLGNRVKDQLTVLKVGSEPIGEPPAIPPEDREDSDDTPVPSPVLSREIRNQRVGVALKRLLQREHVGAAPLILLAARSDIEILPMTLPRVAESELPEIVKNQVLRDSTSYIDGHPLDFLPLGTPGVGDAQKIFSVSITRVTLRHLRSVTSAAKRTPAKIEPRLTTLCEFVATKKYSAEEPVLLVQEGWDEINFALFDENRPHYLRSARIQPELSDEERTERLRGEILRTLTTARANAPDRAVEKVVFFGEPTEHERLASALAAAHLTVEIIDPFLLADLQIKTEVPPIPGRFAPLIGALLAEGPKSRPQIDLLHPRQKPKAPNYVLYFILLLLFLGVAVFWAWRWNEKDLAKKNKEVAKLKTQVESLQQEYQAADPMYRVISNTLAWQYYGVNLLDELRDIMFRIPKSPDMILQRLAYTGSMRGTPAFILSAKIRDAAVYQQFYRNLTTDGSHGVQSNGPQPNPGAAGFPYEFVAFIHCQRRPPAQFLSVLPQNIQNISGAKPEFYDAQYNAIAEMFRQRQFEQQRRQGEQQRPIPQPSGPQYRQDQPSAPNSPPNVAPPYPNPPSPNRPEIPSEPTPTPEAASVTETPSTPENTTTGEPTHSEAAPTP